MNMNDVRMNLDKYVVLLFQRLEIFSDRIENRIYVNVREEFQFEIHEGRRYTFHGACYVDVKRRSLYLPLCIFQNESNL